MRGPLRREEFLLPSAENTSLQLVPPPEECQIQIRLGNREQQAMIKPSRLAFAGLAITAILLAACQGTTSSRGTYAPGYQVSDLSLAARNNGVPLTLTGNPLGMSDAEATVATIERFSVPGWAPQVSFRPREAQDGGYGVVLIFDPPADTTPLQACGVQFGRTLEHAPQRDGHRVVAAFCNGGPMSSMRASFGPVTGPDDPAYRDLLSQISLTLFPAYNPEMRDRGDDSGTITLSR